MTGWGRFCVRRGLPLLAVAIVAGAVATVARADGPTGSIRANWYASTPTSGEPLADPAEFAGFYSEASGGNFTAAQLGLESNSPALELWGGLSLEEGVAAGTALAPETAGVSLITVGATAATVALAYGSQKLIGTILGAGTTSQPSTIYGTRWHYSSGLCGGSNGVQSGCVNGGAPVWYLEFLDSHSHWHAYLPQPCAGSDSCNDFGSASAGNEFYNDAYAATGMTQTGNLTNLGGLDAQQSCTVYEAGPPKSCYVRWKPAGTGTGAMFKGMTVAAVAGSTSGAAQLQASPAPSAPTSNSDPRVASMRSIAYSNPGFRSRINCRLAPSTWYCPGAQYDPATSPPSTALPADDPTSVGGPSQPPEHWTMPNVKGMTLAAAESAIQTAATNANNGTLTWDVRVETLGDADLTVQASHVVRTSPLIASDVGPTVGVIIIYDNPADADMPVVLPQPLEGETGTAYKTRLTAAGMLAPGVAITPVDHTVGDPSKGPNEVTVVEPAPLTRVRKDSAVTVRTNPADWPVPLPGGGASCPCTVRALDFSPLLAVHCGNKFPCGVFSYMTSIFNQFNVSPEAPRFTFHFPSIGGHAISNGGAYDVNLNAFDGYMATLRTLISFCLWISAIWWLATRMLGFGSAGDMGDAADEAVPV